MKKYTLLLVSLLFILSSFAQEKYKYVIIPTQMPTISSGLNPYGLSSSIQRTLIDKSIQCKFKTNETPEDICDALELKVTKLPNMLRSKLKAELHDCMGKIVWTGEGVGRSKTFSEGYAEAFADAMKDLDELPLIQTKYQRIKKEPIAETKIVEEVASKIHSEPITTLAQQASKPVTKSNEGDIYHPGNLYYNYTYFVDMVKEDENIKLLLINGELLGYKNLQVIANLSPSGIENVFTVEWKKPDGKTISGVANHEQDLLKISLKDGEKQLIISLYKQ